MNTTTEGATMETKWTSAAQDAKAIKAALKAKWPHVKWSVRSDSYSMGSSVHVAWTDGPSVRQVETIASAKERIDRDHATGEILCGGNRFVFCNRTASERLRAYARQRLVSAPHRTEWEVCCLTEVRADGQLIEWDRFAKFEKPEPEAKSVEVAPPVGPVLVKGGAKA